MSFTKLRDMITQELSLHPQMYTFLKEEYNFCCFYELAAGAEQNFYSKYFNINN